MHSASLASLISSSIVHRSLIVKSSSSPSLSSTYRVFSTSGGTSSGSIFRSLLWQNIQQSSLVVFFSSVSNSLL